MGKVSYCKKCGIKTKIKAKFLCEKCYRNTLRKICSICGKYNVISIKKNNKIICQTCNKKYYSIPKKRKCYFCGKIDRIDKIFNKKPICSLCNKKYFYNLPKSKCSVCGFVKEINTKLNNKNYCYSCYKSLIYKMPKKMCDHCNNLGEICIIINRKKFCRKCYKNIIKREYYLALNHNRYAKIKQSIGSIGEEDFKTILRRDKVCVYCGSKKKLSFDHIIPLSSGGNSIFSNYVLACLHCNISKGKKDVFEWCSWKKIEVPKIVITLLKKGGNRESNSGHKFHRLVS